MAITNEIFRLLSLFNGYPFTLPVLEQTWVRHVNGKTAVPVWEQGGSHPVLVAAPGPEFSVPSEPESGTKLTAEERANAINVGEKGCLMNVSKTTFAPTWV